MTSTTQDGEIRPGSDHIISMAFLAHPRYREVFTAQCACPEGCETYYLAYDGCPFPTALIAGRIDDGPDPYEAPPVFKPYSPAYPVQVLHPRNN